MSGEVDGARREASGLGCHGPDRNETSFTLVVTWSGSHSWAWMSGSQPGEDASALTVSQKFVSEDAVLSGPGLGEETSSLKPNCWRGAGGTRPRRRRAWCWVDTFGSPGSSGWTRSAPLAFLGMDPEKEGLELHPRRRQLGCAVVPCPERFVGLSQCHQ